MKKLGISIDGVIRNYLETFDKQYRKSFIYNENLVEMTEEFQYREPTEQEIEDRAKNIEKKTNELINLPVDSPDLLNHYQFDEIKEFESENSFKSDNPNPEFENFEKFENRVLEPQEALEKFMYEKHPFKIFGDSEEYVNAMSHFNRIQAFGLKNELFETVLISDLKGAAITANYFFLHKTGSRAKELKVVNSDEEKWEVCDVLIDTKPEAFQCKPNDKISIKVNRLYNQYDEADYSFDDIKEVNHEEFLKKIFK